MHPAFEPCSVVYYQFMDSRTIKAEADFQYDAVLNVLLFVPLVPLGFLYRMVTPRGRGSMLLVIVKAWLYYLQRAHVIWLVSENRASRAPQFLTEDERS